MSQYNTEAEAFVPWFARKVTPAKPPLSPAVSPQQKPQAPPSASHLNTEAPVFMPKAMSAVKYNPDAPTFVPKFVTMDSLVLPATNMTTKTVSEKKPVAPPAAGGSWAKGAPVAPLVKKTEVKKEAHVKKSPAVKPAAHGKAVSPGLKPKHKVPATPPNTPALGPMSLETRNLLPPHSDAEAKLISDKSSLSAGAHVFLPRGMVATVAPAAAAPAVAVAGTQPPPLSTEDVSPPPRAHPEPSHPAGSLVLDNTWQLFYNDFSPSATMQFDPCLVYRIDTLETFWRTINNLPTVTNLPIGSTFFLFKDGIEPKWEDDANKAGGSWSIRFHTQREKPDTIDEVWQLLCARLVGESWADQFQGTVNGMVAKVRDRYITLQVWVTEKSDDFPTDILESVEAVFPAFAADYVAHEDMHLLAQQREQHMASKDKKKRKH